MTADVIAFPRAPLRLVHSAPAAVVDSTAEHQAERAAYAEFKRACNEYDEQPCQQRAHIRRLAYERWRPLYDAIYCRSPQPPSAA